ncbi:hypothetical protein [Methanobrevibacter sp.]|uniref:hypothetical protein n=1 Tax=Methanobrevibacter sp. TaxID=66852 RepID=UPI00388D24E4
MDKKIILLLITLLTCICVIATVSASKAPERIYVNESYNFTYYSFDSAPGKANYFSGIDAYDDAFYFPYEAESKMAEFSPMFNQMFIYGNQYESGDDVDINNVLGQKIGGLSKDKGTFAFNMPVDKNFSFTWTGGHQVGLNDDAKEINAVYDADGKLIWKK